MTTRKDITDICTMLANVFPKYTLGRDTVQAYFNLLKDIPAETLKIASMECATSSPWFPSVYELRKAAVNLHKRADNVPSAAEAWEEMLLAPAHGYSYRNSDEFTEEGFAIVDKITHQFSHPLVEKVARNMGWPDKFWTQSMMSDRSRYMNSYESQLDKSSNEARSVPEVMKYIERTGRGDIKEIASSFRRDALDRGN